MKLTNKEPQYRIPWIVFDRDQVKDFDEIVQAAERNGVGAGWSNPCFEIWMYAYFGEMPVIKNSSTCCDKFAERCYKKCLDDGKKKASDMWPACRVHVLVDEIQEKSKEFKQRSK